MKLSSAARFLPALVVLVVLAPVLWPLPVHEGDWFQFWYAGHLVWTGASPYDPAAWDAATRDYGPIAHGFAYNTFDALDPQAHRWLYPPWTGVVLAPFGALPLEVGISAMHLGLAVLGPVALVLATRLAAPRSAWTEALLLAIGAASMPFVLATRTGHFAAVLLVGVVLLARGLSAGSWRQAAAGTALLALKPHLFIVLAVVVLAFLVAQRAWRSLAAIAVVLGTLVVVGFAISPLPLAALPSDVAGKIAFDVATIWALGSLLGGGLLLAAALAVAAAALALRATRAAARGTSAVTLVAVGAVLSLATAPYAHSYDQLVLLPAVALAVVRADAHRAAGRAAVVVAASAIFVALPWLTYFASLVVASQAPNALVPLATLGLLAVAGRVAPAQSRSYAVKVTPGSA